jgi:hypothetical protein
VRDTREAGKKGKGGRKTEDRGRGRAEVVLSTWTLGDETPSSVGDIRINEMQTHTYVLAGVESWGTSDVTYFTMLEFVPTIQLSGQNNRLEAEFES